MRDQGESADRSELDSLIRQVAEEVAAGAPSERLNAAMLQVMAAQSATLRNIEVLVQDLRTRISSPDGTRMPPAVERRKPASERSTMVVKGKRWSDQCQFCGKGAPEVEAMFSSPTGANICTSCIDMLNALRS